ncbi:TetR/AcrR family transcriptional regulator [Plebeiibacterium marinum]|uniref:TetR/AcrR family transcriptional regulator n=1 Tax=Plebeiibacterium marinum TaxID=2992111 RepID=A0AAE3ME10_9BACT|nr:TetR/AcrR family transcriptional regulator [Plebeiobacterium marinum]MCW3806068.1 TetR/AcrR family transcriptional regulator [Plebeiobacterium marinum]
MPSIREKKAIASRLKLIKTIGLVLKERGYSKLSINLISEESGVDKAFIYRHYTDFDGLLKAYINQQDYWLKNLSKLEGHQIEDHREFMKGLLINQFNDIYNNEELQQFLIWELGDKEGFTTSVAIQREILAEGLYSQARDVFNRYNINANMIYAFFIAGIYYLILHKEKSTFGEFDFTEKQDVEEFIKTLNWLIDLVFDKLETDNKMDDVAIKAHQKGMEVDDIVEITGLSKNRVNTLIHKY